VIGKRAPGGILEKLVAKPPEKPRNDHPGPPAAGAALCREAAATARR
jgi:hypothetical protein